MSTTSPTPPTHRSITLSLPSFGGLRRLRYSVRWGRLGAFIALVLIVAASSYGAGYNGWGISPSGWGTLPITIITLVIIVGLVLAVMARRILLRLLGLVGAFIAGIIVAGNWQAIVASFTSFNWLGVFGLIAAFAAVFAVGLWLFWRGYRAPRPAPTSTP